MTNLNPATTDARGYTKRSTCKENMVAGGTLGAFLVKWGEEVIRVAPGAFPHGERQYIWDHKEEFRGAMLKYRFMSYGMKDVPRFARAVGFRSLIDM